MPVCAQGAASPRRAACGGGRRTRGPIEEHVPEGRAVRARVGRHGRQAPDVRLRTRRRGASVAPRAAPALDFAQAQGAGPQHPLLRSVSTRSAALSTYLCKQVWPALPRQGCERRVHSARELDSGWPDASRGRPARLQAGRQHDVAEVALDVLHALLGAAALPPVPPRRLPHQLGRAQPPAATRRAKFSVSMQARRSGLPEEVIRSVASALNSRHPDTEAGLADEIISDYACRATTSSARVRLGPQTCSICCRAASYTALH